MFYYINRPKRSNGPPQFRLFWESLETSDSSPELCQSLGKVAKCLLCLLSFFLCLHKERKQLFRSVQSLLLEWLMLWTWLALDLYCHRSSTKVPAGSHLPSRGVEGRGLCVKCGRWLDFCLVCTRAAKELVWVLTQTGHLESLTMPICLRVEGGGLVNLTLHISLGWSLIWKLFFHSTGWTNYRTISVSNWTCCLRTPDQDS